MNETDTSMQSAAAISPLQQRISAAEQAAGANEQQHNAEKAADYVPVDAEFKRQLQQPLPQQQHVELPEWKPEPVINPKDYQNFAMGLLAFGLIGGVAAKGRWMQVASSLNGAMDGYMQGNQQLAQDRYNNYKTQFDSAKAKEAQANKEFEDLLKRRDLSIREIMKQYEVLSYKWDRVDAQDAVRRKDIGAMYKSLEHYQTSMDKLGQQNEMFQMRMELQQQKMLMSQQGMGEKGWQVMEDTEGKYGEKGALIRVNPQTGGVKPFEADTAGLKKQAPPTQRFSVNQQMAEKIVKTDIAEVDYGLEEINKLKSKTGSPFFMQAGEGDLSAMHRFAQNKLTLSEQQQYDVYANRLATAIAGAQSQGKYRPTESSIHEAKKLVPVPGDAEATITAKLKTIKRLRDIAEDVLHNKPMDGKGDKSPGEHVDLPSGFVLDQ